MTYCKRDPLGRCTGFHCQYCGSHNELCANGRQRMCYDCLRRKKLPWKRPQKMVEA